jgi:hypothetical protein
MGKAFVVHACIRSGKDGTEQFNMSQTKNERLKNMFSVEYFISLVPHAK